MYSLILQANDRYTAHQMVEIRLRECTAHTRWGQYDDGTIEIRCTEQVDEEWQPIEVPTNGMSIRFLVDTQVRCRSGFRPDGRKRRVVNLDYTRNLDWIERQAPEVGLQLIAVDFDPISIRINRWRRKSPAVTVGHNTRDENRYPFIMSASRFNGTAKIINATLFEQVLASIPRANAKAFGFGFILYETLDTR